MSKYNIAINPEMIKIQREMLGIKPQEANVLLFIPEDADLKQKRKPFAHNLDLNGTLQFATQASKDGCACHGLVNESQNGDRKKITRVRAVFIEDDGDGKELPLKPNLKIYSGGVTADGRRKIHSYFTTSSLTLPEYDLFMENVSLNWGSDPNAKDRARVLRLPGSYHFKTGEPRLCELAEYHAVQYSKEVLFEAFRMKEFIAQKEAKKSQVSKMNNAGNMSSLPNLISNYHQVQRIVEKVMSTHPDCPYDVWIKMGMALRYELGERGFALWYFWSSLGQKFKHAEMRYKWESFHG